jgi:hypothetical protein
MAHRSRRDYKRKAPTRDPEPAILVVTEGQKTEPGYLESLRTCLRLAATRVVVCPADGTDPNSIVDCAVSMRHQRLVDAKRGDVIAYGESWVVFDSEQRLGTPALADALRKAQQYNLLVALSSPCFEYWFVLHFEYTTAYMCSFHEVENRLKMHVTDYNKSSPPMTQLLPRVAEAVHRAAKCRIEQDKAGAELPRTDVDLLISAMNKAAREHNRILGE